MKKILLKLTSLILIVFCVMGVVACKKTTLNFEEIRNALIDRDYEVEIEGEYFDYADCGYAVEEELYAVNDDYEWLVVICYKEESVAKKYFEVLKAEVEMELAIYKTSVEYFKELLKYYEDEMMSDEINGIKDEIKELEAEIKEIEESVKNQMGRNGKYIWYGTKYAVMDSKILE